MQLMLHLDNKQVIVINVEETWTISDLKAEICEKTGISLEHLRVVYKGKDIVNKEETEYLDQYGLNDNATLYILSRLQGGEQMKRIQNI